MHRRERRSELGCCKTGTRSFFFPRYRSRTEVFLLRLVTTLCCIAPAFVHSQYQFASPRVSSGLVALYTFTEGASNPSSLQSVDQSGVNVLGNITLASDPLSAAWTSGRAGLHLNGTGSQTRAVSAFNVTKLISLLSASAGLTVEVWLTPSSTTQKGMILGFGNWSAKAHESGACGDYDIAIFQQGANIAMGFIQNRTAVQCPSVTVPASLTSPSVIFASMNSSSALVIVNAASSSTTAVNNKLGLSTWLSSMLLFFGQPVYNNLGLYTTNTWAGDVFLLAIYNRTLQMSEVAQNYAAGIPYSTPEPSPTLVWLAVEENALAADISTLSSSPFILNYTNTDSAAYSAVSMAITTAPEYGTLFSSPDMTQIGNGGASLPFSFSVGQAFAYQPPAVFSGVDNVTFTPTTSVGSGSSGVIYILVIAPPASDDVSVSVLVSEQVTVNLNSYDLNTFAISSALGALITSLPASGQLYQTPDGNALETAITTTPTMVSNSNLSVIYVDTAGSTAAEGGVDVLYSDAFQFQAQVTYNGTTVFAAQPNTVTVSVTNFMVAYPGRSSWSYTALNASTLVLLNLAGSNLLDGPVNYVVQQLPIYGALYTNLSISSAITSTGVTLSSSAVYYAPVPYMYSDSINPVLFPSVIDTFLFATQDSNGLNSSTATYTLTLSVSTVPYPSCASLATLYTRQWFTNRTCDESLLFLYTFEEGQLNASATQTADVSWQQLLGPLLMDARRPSQWLSGQAGVYLNGAKDAPALVSANNATRVYAQVQSQHHESFCIEGWIQPDDIASQYAAVFGFSPYTSVRQTSQDCSDAMDVAVVQVAGQSAFRSDVSTGCTITYGALGSDLQHVVGCMDGIALSTVLYVDGAWAGSGSVPSDYQPSWAATSQLMISSETDAQTNAATWQGSVFLVAMYSRSLTAAEVLANYNAGLPDNLPVPGIRIQHVTANASVNSSLSSISLSASDIDQELILQSPYNQWVQPQVVTLYITALPNATLGNLSILYLNGAPSVTLTSPMLPYALPLDNSTYSLWFLSGALTTSQQQLPAYSLITSYASFQVTPNDGYNYGPTATVYIDLLTQPAVPSSSSSSPSSSSSASSSSSSSSSPPMSQASSSTSSPIPSSSSSSSSFSTSSSSLDCSSFGSSAVSSTSSIVSSSSSSSPSSSSVIASSSSTSSAVASSTFSSSLPPSSSSSETSSFDSSSGSSSSSIASSSSLDGSSASSSSSLRTAPSSSSPLFSSNSLASSQSSSSPSSSATSIVSASSSSLSPSSTSSAATLASSTVSSASASSSSDGGLDVSSCGSSSSSIFSSLVSSSTSSSNSLPIAPSSSSVTSSASTATSSLPTSGPSSSTSSYTDSSSVQSSSVLSSAPPSSSLLESSSSSLDSSQPSSSTGSSAASSFSSDSSSSSFSSSASSSSSTLDSSSSSLFASAPPFSSQSSSVASSSSLSSSSAPSSSGSSSISASSSTTSSPTSSLVSSSPGSSSTSSSAGTSSSSLPSSSSLSSIAAASSSSPGSSFPMASSSAAPSSSASAASSSSSNISQSSSAGSSSISSSLGSTAWCSSITSSLASSSSASATSSSSASGMDPPTSSLSAIPSPPSSSAPTSPPSSSSLTAGASSSSSFPASVTSSSASSSTSRIAASASSSSGASSSSSSSVSTASPESSSLTGASSSSACSSSIVSSSPSSSSSSPAPSSATASTGTSTSALSSSFTTSSAATSSSSQSSSSQWRSSSGFASSSSVTSPALQLPSSSSFSNASLTSAQQLSTSSSASASPPSSPSTASPTSATPIGASSSSSPQPTGDTCPNFPSSCFVSLPPGCYSPFFQRVGERLGLVVPFTEGESCSSCHSASDYSCNQVGSITLGADSAEWLTSEAGVLLLGSGVDDRLVSAFSMDSVMASATSAVTGSTAELWLLPASLNEYNAVMTIGAVPAAGSYDPAYSEIEPGDAMLLAQSGSTFELVVQLDPFGATAPLSITADVPTTTNPHPYYPMSRPRSFQPMQTAAPTLTQLVLVLNASANTTQLYVNGGLAVTLTQPLAPLSFWFTDSSFLSFGQTSSDGSGSTWAGEIRLLAFYTQALSQARVLVNWNASLPSAVPQPPAVVTINWSRAQPTFTVNFTTPHAPVIVTITGIPPGVLSFLNGSVPTIITKGALPLAINGTLPVVFTYSPPAGMNVSFVANITYTLSAPAAPTQASNPGVLQFVVEPAIAPPLAISTAINVTAQVPYLFQLPGLDQDNTTATAPVTSAFVQSLPSSGVLYQCNGDGTRGTAITSISAQGQVFGSAGQLVEVSDHQLRLWYVPNAAGLSYSEHVVVGPPDSFLFRVLVKGTLSSHGTVSIATYNNLQAFPVQLTLVTDSPVTVPLSGIDAANGSLTYAIVHVAQHGQLLDANNLSVEAMATVELPLYYVTSQDRYSGMYDRSLAPVPDSFTYSAMSPSGLLSVPALVSVSFSPAPGPPLLVVDGPFDAALLVVGIPANFSVFINATGLEDPDTTLWACSLTLTPSTGTIGFNTSTVLPTVTVTSAIPTLLAFTAQTSDANALLSALTFTGSVAGEYTVAVTVVNAGMTGVESTASLVLEVTTESGSGTGGDAAAPVLPFNALYVWITVGILVALILIALILRRYLSEQHREPVLTNEERHILNKARGGPRLDPGVIRATRGVVPDNATSDTQSTPVISAAATTELGSAPVVGPGSGQGQDEDVLAGMTPVCLANVNLAESSHLGSRLDSDLWGAFGEAAQQRRGVQLVPVSTLPQAQFTATASRLPPVVPEVDERYSGTEPVILQSTQPLSASLGASQLAVVPADNPQSMSVSSRRPARLLLATYSFDRQAPRPASEEEVKPEERVVRSATTTSASFMTQFQHARLMPVNTAGLLASPRLAPTNPPTPRPSTSTPLREQIVPVSSAPEPRRKLSVPVVPERPLPRSPASPQRSPVHSDQPGPRRPRSLSLTTGVNELVPVNPMLPVNVESPRYALDVYNRMTGVREKFRGLAEMGDQSAGVITAVVLGDHPLFRGKAEGSVEEKEE